MNTRFFCKFKFLRYVWSRFCACCFVLCGFGNILDCNALSGVGLAILSAFGYLDIPYKLVMNPEQPDGALRGLSGHSPWRMCFPWCWLQYCISSQCGKWKPKWIRQYIDFDNLSEKEVLYMNSNLVITIGRSFGSGKLGTDGAVKLIMDYIDLCQKAR